MRIPFKLALLALTILAISGCGGGGSSISSGNGTTPSSGKTIVSGIAAKGVLSSGTVKVYRINSSSGVVDTSVFGLIIAVSIQQDGSFIADLGTYVGPIYVTAFGQYKDEATGSIQTISENEPLQAAVAEAKGATTVTVTPLTTLAVGKAGYLNHSGLLKPLDITAANALISDLFKIDIINVKPVDFFDTNAIKDANQKSRDYTMALAAFSKMAAGGAFSDVITYYRNETNTGIMTVAAAQKFQTAVAVFKTSLDTYYTNTNLDQVGTKTVEIRILVNGPPAPYKGFDLTLQLPVGVSVKFQGLNETGTSTLIAGELVASGVASGVDFTAASYETPASAASGGNVYMTLSATLTAGEVATLRCYFAAGLLPSLGGFTIAHFKPVDGFGMDMSSIYTPSLEWK